MEPLSPEAMKEKWRDVKDRLIRRQLIIDQEGSLSVNNSLSVMIRIVCNPKLFVLLQHTEKDEAAGDGKKLASKCYYISRRCAVKIDEENRSGDYYYLTFFDEKEALFADLQESYRVDEKHGYSPNRVTMPQTQFDEYMKEVHGTDGHQAYQTLTELGFPDECALDLNDALKTKNHLLTLTTVSFDPSTEEKQSIANQSLLFSGKKYVWQIDAERNVSIHGTNADIFSRKLEIVSELFNYF